MFLIFQLPPKALNYTLVRIFECSYKKTCVWYLGDVTSTLITDCALVIIILICLLKNDLLHIIIHFL